LTKKSDDLKFPFAIMAGYTASYLLNQLFTPEKIKARVPYTIQTSYNTIIKPVMLDSFGRPNLKFILGDTPDYV